MPAMQEKKALQSAIVWKDIRSYDELVSAGIQELDGATAYLTALAAPIAEKNNWEILHAIRVVYAAIYAIENTLSEAIYLPHDMRKSRIELVLSSLGISKETYTEILQKWSRE